MKTVRTTQGSRNEIGAGWAAEKKAQNICFQKGIFRPKGHYLGLFSLTSTFYLVIIYISTLNKTVMYVCWLVCWFV